MSDEVAERTPATTAGDDSPIKFKPETDFFLAQLVRWANQWGIEQGVTLAVGGAVVSGDLIGGKQYFEELADTITATVTPADGQNEIKTTIAAFYKQYAALYEKPEGAQDDWSPPPTFIHLRNARWVYPDRLIPGNRGVLWRGKLSAVDGFCLGRPGTPPT